MLSAAVVSFSILVSAYILHYTDAIGRTNGLTQPLNDNTTCAPWYFYDSDPLDPGCKEYRNSNTLLKEGIRYSCKGAQLKIGYCTTYNKNTMEVFLSKCRYFQLTGQNLSNTEPGYIRLPNRASELNDYMCRQMNRTGLLCSECIEGFGPSLTSPGYICSNCTGTWNRILLYILIELLPVTIFYATILIFGISLTVSPMTAYILYSQIIMSTAFYSRDSAIINQSFQTKHAGASLYLLYGVWNLDFIRYALPPFCVSRNLNLTSVVLLEFVSVMYPLLLVLVTWICVDLHDHGFRLLVWLWRPFHRCCVQLRRGWDTKRDIIDVFSAFMLLSHNKLLYQLTFLLFCKDLVKVSSSDHTLHEMSVAGLNVNIQCGSSLYLMFAIPACLGLVLISLPVLLLILYPIKPFKTCLSRCRLDFMTARIFIDRFHSCYKDGLDGGKDMRSFSGFYFLLRYVLCLGSILQDLYFLPDTLKVKTINIPCLVFISSAVLIALIRPYKKYYMNVLDTLLLMLLALAILLSPLEYTTIDNIVLLVIASIPGLVFGVYVVYKVSFLLLKKCFVRCIRKLPSENELENSISEGENEQQRRLIEATQSLTLPIYGSA